ncbi:hypothetical protein [Rhizobium sp. BR 314]|uniref:hypothetical protein n=1 Tax=Rhizobium sp. BR 314 TaxID=3040013 RepID=UPI0039BEF4D4
MFKLSDEILQALQDATPTGFDQVSERRWVSEPRNAIRRIIEFQALKGAYYSARWGFSVDFVPRLRSGRLSWKRSLKSADFDLTIDPIDIEGAATDWCSFPFDVKIRDARKTVDDVKRVASLDLASIDTINDLLDLFKRRSEMKFRRFGLANYIQTDIAWGLSQLAAGEVVEGSDRIARFCEQFEIDPNSAILTKARAEALQAMGNGNA